MIEMPLSERVARLEQENRRIMAQSKTRARMLIFSAAMGALVLGLGGAKLAEKPKVVEAERFVLRDSQGKMRAEWTLEDGDIVQIFYDEKGKPRLEMGVAANDSVGLMLLDQEGHPRLDLSLDQDGSAGLAGFDKKSLAPRFTLGVEADGLPAQSFSDSKDVPRIEIIIDPHNKPTITLWGSKRELLFRAPPLGNGVPAKPPLVL
jgi:hypothetical protein